jgi:hypothetical protein
MKTLLALLLSLVALVGCDQAPTPDDHDVYLQAPGGFERDFAPTDPIYLPQHPDFEAVWAMVGGKGHAPKVVIVEDAELDCPEGGQRYVDPQLGCVGGHYDIPSNTVHVTRAYLWWRLGHELVHAAKFQATGDSDPGHSGLGGLDILKWERPILDPVEAFLYARGWL